jgi:hypothetical protein
MRTVSSLDERSFIQICGTVVERRANQFYAALKSLLAGVRTFERRQERVVNIEDLIQVSILAASETKPNPISFTLFRHHYSPKFLAIGFSTTNGSFPFLKLRFRDLLAIR